MKKNTKKYYYAVISSESYEVNDSRIYESIDVATAEAELKDFIVSLEVVDVYRINKNISKSSIESLEEQLEENKTLF